MCVVCCIGVLARLTIPWLGQLPDALSEGWLQFNIEILLPMSSTNPRKSPHGGLLSPFTALYVYLPMFHQTFDLEGLPEVLTSVLVEGASAPITAKVSYRFWVKQSSHPSTQHLEARYLSVLNSLASITGNFGTYAGYLSIQATKGSLIAGVVTAC